jgi:hypothetical protein
LLPRSLRKVVEIFASITICRRQQGWYEASIG